MLAAPRTALTRARRPIHRRGEGSRELLGVAVSLGAEHVHDVQLARIARLGDATRLEERYVALHPQIQADDDSVCVSHDFLLGD